MRCGLVLKSTVFVLALQGGIAPDAIADGDVVGQLGNVELKIDDAKKLLDAVNPRAKAQLAASQAGMERFVRSELVREELAAEAQAQGWDKKPEVQAAMARAREQVLIASYLNGLAQPEAGYPGDDEIQSFYDANQAQFQVQKQYHLAQIYLAAPAGADAAAVEAKQKQAEDLAAQARSGTDFAGLAKSYSEHKPSAANGGDLGWVSANALVPEVRAALNKLASNDVSPPVKTSRGWHILKLLDTKPATVRPLSEVHDAIAAELRARKVQENGAKYVNDLLRKTPPVINQAELSKLRDAIR